jgi:hypothetical protein
MRFEVTSKIRNGVKCFSDESHKKLTFLIER